MDYTKEWIKKINRGGLFELSDNTFQLFQAIELALCQMLVLHLRDEGSEYKPAIVSAVAQDDVLFYWSMSSIDITGESHSAELLNKVIDLWVIIRGFSIASTWTEQYKQASKATKAKHSLRKGLRDLSKKDDV